MNFLKISKSDFIEILKICFVILFAFGMCCIIFPPSREREIQKVEYSIQELQNKKDVTEKDVFDLIEKTSKIESKNFLGKTKKPFNIIITNVIKDDDKKIYTLNLNSDKNFNIYIKNK